VPYKDPAKQLAFQKAWVNNRRAAWIAANGPCKKCGETKELFAVHTDPTEKFRSHFWTYCDATRNEILSKCIVLCRRHKAEHWGRIFRKEYTGRRGTAESLTAEMVWAIRGRLLGRETVREIAEHYRITHGVVLAIQKGKIWSWLKGGRRQVHGITRWEMG